MTVFTGNASGNTARADNGTLTGFTGGVVGDLTDANADTFNAGGGNDTVIAGNAADTINGDAGDDNLGGSGGADTINGGGGVDEVRYDRDNAMVGGSFVVVNLSGSAGSWGGFTVDAGRARDGFGATDILLNIEAIRGTQFNDFLIGGAAANGTGGSGFEGFRGLGGADFIDGGQGYDEVRHDQDNANGGSSGVIVNLGTTSYTTTGAESGWAAGITVLSNNARDGFGATDTLVSIEGARGTQFADIFFGGNTVDDITDNTFTGLAGNDTFIGGAGFDQLRYDVDSAFGGAAGVTVNLQTGTATDGFGNTDTISGFESVVGTSQSDTITGRDYIGFFGDGLIGLGGADVINGGTGLDEVRYDRDAAAGGTLGVSVDLANGTATDGFGMGDILTGIENVRGTNSVDTITGSDRNNTFRGLGGADSFSGGDGNDTVAYDRDANNGGNGGVTVNLGAGSATDGFGNTDTFNSIENVRGTGQIDSLTGSDEDNSLMGLAGNDSLVGGNGTGDEARYDVDWYFGGLNGVTVNLSTGIATDGFGNTDTLSGIEVVRGTFFADTFIGGNADEVFRGNGGDDVINGGAGSDTVSFSTDVFSALETDTLSGVIVNLSSASVLVNTYTVLSNNARGSFGDTDTLISIENATGGHLNDTLIGSNGNNVLRGLDGSDTLDGGAGTDTADYSRDAEVGANQDRLANNGVFINLGTGVAYDGFGLADTLISIENVIGTDFSDNITGNASNNLLDGGVGVDTLNGAAGSDTVDYRWLSGPGGMIVDLASGYSWDGTSTDFLTSIENVIGSNQGDTLVGNSADNILEGMGGTDFVQGGGGDDAASYRHSASGVIVDLNARYSWDGSAMDFLTSIESTIGTEQTDTLVGNSGNNTLEGLGGTDFIQGGGGSDTASYRSAAAGVIVDLGSQYSWDGTSMDFLSSIENAIGSNQTDTLVGDANGNILEGLGGTDYIQGGGGSDTASYRSSGAGVTLDLVSQVSWDGTSVDFLSSIENGIGSAFGDVLFGTGSDNIFEGLAGNDVLVGNGGSDTFRFLSSGTGDDTITDFDADPAGGQDFIDVSGRGFTAGSIGSSIVISSLGGTSTLIQIGTDTIVLNNVVSTNVTAADFIF